MYFSNWWFLTFHWFLWESNSISWHFWRWLGVGELTQVVERSLCHWEMPDSHWHAHTRGLPGGLPKVVGTVQQVHCSRRRLLRRGLEFHVCIINKSAHTKKFENLFNDSRIYKLTWFPNNSIDFLKQRGNFCAKLWFLYAYSYIYLLIGAFALVFKCLLQTIYELASCVQIPRAIGTFYRVER